MSWERITDMKPPVEDIRLTGHLLPVPDPTTPATIAEVIDGDGNGCPDAYVDIHSSQCFNGVVCDEGDVKKHMEIWIHTPHTYGDPDLDDMLNHEALQDIYFGPIQGAEIYIGSFVPGVAGEQVAVIHDGELRIYKWMPDPSEPNVCKEQNPNLAALEGPPKPQPKSREQHGKKVPPPLSEDRPASIPIPDTF